MKKKERMENFKMNKIKEEIWSVLGDSGDGELRLGDDESVGGGESEEIVKRRESEMMMMSDRECGFHRG
jgi:beta-xylosidase